jgi:hypothetical protein
MWGLAKFAASFRPSALARPAPAQSAPSTGAHGLAQITAPKSKPNGATTLTHSALYRRGLMLHNRDQSAALRYARTNMILVKGACCEAG